MGVKMATTCLHWSQPSVRHSPSSFQTLATSFPSKRGSGNDGALACRYIHGLERSFLLGTSPTKLYRSRSCDVHKPVGRAMKRVCSANLDAFSEEDFARKIQELALKFQLSEDDKSRDNDLVDKYSEIASDFGDVQRKSDFDNHNNFDGGSCNLNSSADLSQNKTRNEVSMTNIDPMGPPWPEIRMQTPDWQRDDEILSANIEMKANSVDLPLSLRIIKRKKQWQEQFREAGDSACSSVKKAFSSLVFIMRELHSYSLQMRELLFYEDLQGVMFRVQQEMHASFVWLFQQVFSHTPTLMVSVMVLLANFTVYSMGNNAAFAASASPSSYATLMESVSVIEHKMEKQSKFGSSNRILSLSSSSGKTNSVGGNNGGGGRIRRIASGTDGEGRFDGSDHHRTILPDEVAQFSSLGNSTKTSEESVSGHLTGEEEVKLWNSIVEEASRIQGALRDESLNHDTVQSFVSPVTATIEEDDYVEYIQTELVYLTGLAQEPNNALLLANYAQFLHLVFHDDDRAEEYFKRAVAAVPADAEAYCKYANFLWKVKKDLWAAEETFLEAINADPSNAFYASNYAHFLWNTGGEETCYPLDQSQA